MDNLVLKASKREITGRHVKKARREGMLPGVIYGKAIGSPILISMDQREASKLLRNVGSSTLLTLEVDGQAIPTLVRERQRDFLRGHYLHIDFLAISLTERVRAMVSIVLEGESLAVKDGGLMITGVEEVEVEALPQDLPERFHLDISVLKEIGDGIHVSDLPIPAGVDLLTDPEEMIVVITAPATVAAAEEEEGLEPVEGEPEVIEKGKTEDDEESES